MGLFNFLKKQLIDVVEWTESGDGVLAIRVPMQDHEIQNGAQLTVRESQAALFVNEGIAADLFGPGLHTLATKNLPLLTSLKNWDKGFNSPFKSDVYFFSLREQLDQRWGTQQPITVRDKEFGAIRIRAHGNYSYRLNDARLFFKKISGTRDLYSTADLDGQLRGLVITELASFFGHSEIAFVDMAGNQKQFSETLKGVLAKPFEEYGLQLTSFFVQSVSLPDTLQEQLDKTGAQRMVGDLQKYAQFQAADSIHTAAANPGGMAGAGAGIGAGVAMGQAIMGAANNGGGDAGANSADAIQKIGQLAELLQKGILTQSEFDAKKAELLKRIT